MTMTSIRESTASGSSRILVSVSRCSFTPVLVSRPNNSPIPRTNGYVRPRSPISSNRWCWEPSKGRSSARYQFRLAPPTFPTTHREAAMPDRVTYYAVVDDLSSRKQPAGVFRRTYTDDGGRSDEAFTRDLIWEFSPALIAAERGDLQNDFIEITEDEANQIVESIRARVAGASGT